jgi:DNA-binding transcriptional MerR regulator
MREALTADESDVGLTREEIEAQLKQLEAEERSLSVNRRRLHDRIALYPDVGSSDLDEQERALSQRRKDLHAQIDRLRASRHNGDHA